MTADGPRKIFLSHKSSDKGLVLDFKETLDLLGYQTWLDDEAMPAGTTLERALLKGMQESRAVVFFITSSFEDEGYLETEITYAIQEKRYKDGDFAIITLLLKGNDGETAPVPDLLRPYVWKTPRTHLEALREIIRALPVVPGSIESQDEITAVAARPEMPSRIAGLSDEAKALLLEAAREGGDGTVIDEPLLNYHYIHASREQMIPNQEPRTVARWKGGLKQLERYGYIEGIGYEGEVFEVTQEGYEAADEILET